MNQTDFKNFLKTTYQATKEVDLGEIEKSKRELDDHRPLPKGALQSLEDKLEIDEVHNSTAIEGNTLTLGETALVLTKGLTVSGKSLKDHLEVKGHDNAYKFIKAVYKNRELNEELILEIHKLLFSDFTDDLKKQLDYGVGKYRNQAVFIKGSSFVPPNYAQVPDLMNVLIEFLQEIENDPVRKATIAHLGLVTVHPFIDGNGRTARLLMNFILLKNGYPIVIVKNDKRADYLNTLEAVQSNPEKTDFFELTTEFLSDTFKLYKETYE